MDAADLDAVCVLEQRAYPFPWSRAIIGGCTTVPYRIWLAEIPGQAAHVSQAFLSITAGEAHLLNVAVDPAWQAQGIGSAMLRHLIADATAQNAGQMFLEVRESNQPAIQMYLRHGFNEIGRRNGYYPAGDRREDALVFALQLRFDQI